MNIIIHREKIVGVKMRKNTNVFQLTVISMFVAILILQTFVPFLGYIPLGTIDITIVHITVILAAVLFGPKIGLIIGTSWGLLSLIRAYTRLTAFNFVFLNPLISVLPRLLVGWLSGILFNGLKNKVSEQMAYAITAFIGTLLNTILVLGSIYLFASESYAAALGVPESALLGILGTIVITNGVVEAIASVIILPLIAIPISRVLKRRNFIN
jgi:uncharacterized membrane protein